MNWKYILLFGIVLPAATEGCSTFCSTSHPLQVHISQGGGDGSPYLLQVGQETSARAWRKDSDEQKVRGHVNVAIVNRSKEKWLIWPQRCRAGNYNIWFTFWDERGKRYQVRFRMLYRRFYRKVHTDPVILEPGAVYVRDCFVQGWRWSPALPPGRHKLTGYATFTDQLPPELLPPGGLREWYPWVSPEKGRAFHGWLKSNTITVTVDNRAWEVP